MVVSYQQWLYRYPFGTLFVGEWFFVNEMIIETKGLSFPSLEGAEPLRWGKGWNPWIFPPEFVKAGPKNPQLNPDTFISVEPNTWGTPWVISWLWFFFGSWIDILMVYDMIPT